MKTRNDLFLVALIYSMAAIFLFAILRYVTFYVLRFNPGADDRLIGIRVFFSGPGLVIIAIVIFIFKFNTTVHRVFGILFFLIGVAWLIFLIRTVIQEAA